MRAVDLIIKKRDGFELSQEEIEFMIQGYTKGDIPDYQISAWLMAILLNGMSEVETKELTMAMAHSGDILDLSGTVDIALDKHSTGGVGDKTSLVVAPIVTANGIPVGKMSGRGLGFTGGTLDKMESIPGFRTDLSTEEFLKQLKEDRIVLTGQTGDLAPADGKLYALRDVTGTVKAIPLIASSIMSKKIASGAQRMLLDVKVGVGAFMNNLDEARELSRLMVEIGTLANRKAIAVLSDMNQPLGYAVGNSLEVIEAIETLQGGGAEDFREHCLDVSAYLLILGDAAKDLEEAKQKVQAVIDDGSAFEVFKTLVRAQGGDVSYVDDVTKFPVASIIETVNAPQSGYLKQIHAREIGETAVELGAGRAIKSDPIDHSVGIMIHTKVGDYVTPDSPLFTIYANDAEKCAKAKERLLKAYQYCETEIEKLPLFYDVIGM